MLAENKVKEINESVIDISDVSVLKTSIIYC